MISAAQARDLIDRGVPHSLFDQTIANIDQLVRVSASRKRTRVAAYIPESVQDRVLRTLIQYGYDVTRNDQTQIYTIRWS